eukprot:5927465-Amphidinium_carterae.1
MPVRNRSCESAESLGAVPVESRDGAALATHQHLRCARWGVGVLSLGSHTQQLESADYPAFLRGVGAVTGVRAEAQTQVTGAMSGVLEKIWFRPAKIVVAVLRGARALGSWKQTGADWEASTSYCH